MTEPKDAPRRLKEVTAPGASARSNAVDTAGDDAADNGGNFVSALARGLAVIKAFTQQNQHLTLSEVARIVNLTRATTRRSLMTLEALGYVDRRDRHFSLSPMVLTIAQAYLTSSVLPRIAQAFLERLSEQLNESCSVSILYRTDVIYVARSARKRMASLHREVGSRLPAYPTSMGRVLLAALSESELRDYFDQVSLTALTPNTVTSPTRLKAILKQVAKDGYCYAEGELEANLRGVAVPLRNAAGAVVGALHISSMQTTRTRMLKEFLPALLQAAAEIRPLLIS
jgi:IclR family pca regulon transcriptional regulator